MKKLLLLLLLPFVSYGQGSWINVQLQLDQFPSETQWMLQNINGDTPKKVVTEVNIIGLARTLQASRIASILFLPSALNLFVKSISIKESFTTIPMSANRPITERNCKLYPNNM